MSNANLKKYLPLIRLLSRKNLTREFFTAVVQSLDEPAIKFLCECVKNSTSTQYLSQLDEKKKKGFLKKILPNRKILKRLCRKVKHYSQHKNLLIQKGYGIIIPILSAVAPLIASLLASR